MGRTRERALVARLVAECERLLTFVGPAGSGKTRLAHRCAADLASSAAAAGGVCFCDLSEARAPDQVFAAIAATLGVPAPSEPSALAAAAQLGHALAARAPLLIVLDNFEQLVTHATETLGALRGYAPEVTLLVTSRTRLHLEGEAAVEVGPLEEDDAVALFEARAQRASPSFAPAPAETPQHHELRALVRALDHNALAIELAAARVKVLPPRALLERLASRLDLLRSAHRDGIARHATLRTALDGSWELLSATEQRALAQASVFRGGFTLAAAEAVLDRGEPGAPIALVLDALADHSLLARDEGNDGEARFRLLETVREYAAEKLDAIGDREATAARHATHYLGAVEAWIGASGAPWAARAEERLAREVDNVAAIARRSVTERDARTCARAAVAMHALLAARGPGDAERALEEAARLLAAPGDVEPALAARVHVAAADVRRLGGDLDGARGAIASALGAALAAGPAEEALARVVLAHVEIDAGRIERAREAARAAVESARRSSALRIEAVALYGLARLHVDAGEVDAARAVLDEALPLSRRAGARLVESRVENLLGVVAGRAARLDAAKAHYEASLAIARVLGDAYLECTVTANLANVHARRGDRERAFELYEASLAHTRRMGFRRAEAVSTTQLAMLEHDAGRPAAARAHHDAAIAIHRELGNPRSEAFALELRGLVALDEARLDEALEILDRAIALARAHALATVDGASSAYLASVRAARGDDEGAERALADARAATSWLRQSEGRALVDVHEALARTARAAREPDPLEAARLLDAARAAHVRAAEHEGASARVRVSRRLLARAFASAASAPVARAAPPLEPSLDVGADGRWFMRDGGAVVDLSRRRSLRLLVLRFTKSRLETPGVALSLEDLFEAGWPGEHIDHGAALRRVYTAIGTLRDLGLRDILVRRDDGYLLSPGTRVTEHAERAPV